MTSDEIKETVTMRDVLAMYRIKVSSSGMCSCPFHDDKHPSMKVFKDGYKCFSCNRSGDIFGFIQEYENCSFKDAFMSLGGTYEYENKRAANIRREMYKRNGNDNRFADEILKTRNTNLNDQISELRERIEKYEPLSDEWCALKNEIERLLYRGGHLDE